MTSESGPKEPSRPTTKRLFALSGNRCAFPRCTTALIDAASGSVVGEICHICGDRPDAARYDAEQTNEQRQSFDNLILLCNVHHKIVDDDEISYTVKRLCQIKREHESRHVAETPVDNAAAEQFVSIVLHGSVITNHGQTGGQTAHVIHNHYRSLEPDEAVQVVGKLEVASNMQSVQQVGCFGLQLTVICRSKRPAKIRSAHMLVKGHGFLESFQQGFAADFGHTPLAGEPETLAVELVRQTPPNHHEGNVLNRDDVCRFFYPLPLPSTLLALKARADDVTVAIKYFDGEEQELLDGADVQPVLQALFDMYKDRPGKLKCHVNVEIRGKSKTPPKADNIFQTNVRGVTLVRDREDANTKRPVPKSSAPSSADGLSPLAVEMLRAAKEAGIVRETQTDQGGYLIRCGARAFHNQEDGAVMARRRAELHAALWELLMGRYIESIGERGGTTYQLSQRAYELLDQLANKAENA